MSNRSLCSRIVTGCLITSSKYRMITQPTDSININSNHGLIISNVHTGVCDFFLYSTNKSNRLCKLSVIMPYLMVIWNVITAYYNKRHMASSLLSRFNCFQTVCRSTHGEKYTFLSCFLINSLLLGGYSFCLKMLNFHTTTYQRARATTHTHRLTHEHSLSLDTTVGNSDKKQWNSILATRFRNTTHKLYGVSI